MATSTTSTEREASIGYSIFRSLVTPYWVFSAYVLGYMTVGAALGGAVTGFSFDRYILMGVALWFGLEGLHAVDLASTTVALRLNNRVSKILGYTQVGIGGLIGVYLASQTSWLFLGFVGAALFFGLAYNEEWFEGIFHDNERLSGLLNFGFAWGIIPVLGGYFVIAETIPLAMIPIGLAVMLDAIRVILLFESGKPAPYEDLDIFYNRDYEENIEMVRSATHTSNKLGTLSWVLFAVGTMGLFVF